MRNAMKINYYDLSNLTPAEKAKLLKRTEEDIDSVRQPVQVIIDEVRQKGDAAICHYCSLFDKATLTAADLKVTASEITKAVARLEPKLKSAIDTCIKNIKYFHKSQLSEKMWMKEIVPGVIAGEKTTPIPSVGLYVPRGKGSFPSVMMMLGVPAVLAGVPRIVVCTPPLADGSVDDATLYAADSCGITEIYKVGGAQAVAALAFGTSTVPKVDKVLGPGNKYVSAAKRLLYGKIDVGTPAGPSEAIILCDEHADPRMVAQDLLIEAEHGPDSAALLVTHSKSMTQKVMDYLPALVDALPAERKRYCEAVMSGFGGIILTTSLEESVDFVNAFAPEHIEVLVEDPLSLLPQIHNAGEILLGPHCPITLGNFAIGVNAILPTGGFARTFSCVGVHDFVKRSSFAYVSKKGYSALSPAAGILADFEGFPAHKAALDLRAKSAARG
jgi:histidinol dehydrogenase